MSDTTAFATMQDVWEAYNQGHVRGVRRPGAIRCRVKNYFAPILALPTSSLTVMTVRGWLTDIRTGANGRMPSAASANACLTTLRAMINYAIECGMWTLANPASRCKKTPGNVRRVYVTAESMPKLIQVLEHYPARERLYFYLVLFSGCRPGEAEVIRIEDVEEGVWRKPTTKTGQEQAMMLPDDITKLIRQTIAAGYQDQVYLFENHHTRQPYSKTFWHRIWRDVRKDASIPNVNPHDLRRTCSTRLRNNKNLDLMSISKGVLNHSNIGTTERYMVEDLENVKRALTENMKQARMQGGQL